MFSVLQTLFVISVFLLIQIDVYADFGVTRKAARGGGGGYSPNMVNGGVPLKWVTFFKKSLNKGSGFAKKIPKHAPHFCNFTVDTRYFRPFRR